MNKVDWVQLIIKWSTIDQTDPIEVYAEPSGCHMPQLDSMVDHAYYLCLVSCREMLIGKLKTMFFGYLSRGCHGQAK